MLKRQNQNETIENVSMYGNEGYNPPAWYNYADYTHQTFSYYPGKYGDAYDQAMSANCKGYLDWLFSWL